MNPAEIFRRVAQQRLSVDEAFELIKNGAGGAPKNRSAIGGDDAGRSAQQLGPSDRSPDILLHTANWQEAPLSPLLNEKDIGEVLLFDHDETLRTDLQAQPGWAGAGALILVTPASRFEQHNRTTYAMRPDHADDYGRLLDILEQERLRPNLILHCWSCEPDLQTPEALTPALQKGGQAVFYLLKALLSRAPRQPRRLIYAYALDNGPPPPICAAMAGMARTVRQEVPQTVFKVIGLAFDAGGAGAVTAGQKAFTLWAERQDQAAGDTEVLYRGDLRLVRRLQPLESIPAVETSPQIKEGSVWIITGGLGGLGFIWAQALAQRFGARLVLCGRSDPTERQQARLQRLGALGAQSVYLKADVATREGCAAILAAAEKRFGAVNGIIHAAGVIRDAFLIKKSPADFKAVLAPKVYGAYYLDLLSRELPLDFFILFSAMAGIFGNPGQSDYAFGNAFLDALAAWREDQRIQGRRQGRSLAINWPLWAEGGMTVDAESRRMMRQTAGLIPLPTAEGLEAFFKALALDTPQVLVLCGQQDKLQRFLRLHAAAVPIAASAPCEAAPAQDAGLGRVLQQELVELVSDLIKIDPQRIQPDGDMADYGFDSIKLTALANRINERFGLEMTPAIFFELEAPSIAACASYLLNTQKEHLQHYYGEPAGELRLIGKPPPAPASQAQPQPVHNGHIEPAADQATAGQLPSEPLAVIGMAGVMPQSEDLETYWRHLAAQEHMVTEIPPERWDWRAYYGDPKQDPAKTRVKWGAFMPTVDRFDAKFFGISPREAELMDPQQRIFMQLVWHVIEDAGYSAADFSGSATGLFVGVQHSDYAAVLREGQIGLGAYAAIGISPSILVNRISYFLNLTGPSESINTACSSSLVALHRAVEAIRNGSCEMAIVGGVNVILNPAAHVSAGLVGFLSEKGQCRSFDQGADGTVRGEGAGAILIKSLAQAQADGDHIYALIRGSAENHGGRANSLTAPNANAQAKLLIKAYRQAGIDPASVGYIEAHGTATRLGDPVEINGIRKAFETLTAEYGPTAIKAPRCGIGSVKSNIGHLETAAGIAGVLKVLLAMQHKTLPASVHFETPNDHLRLDQTPFYIVSHTQPWQCLYTADGKALPRRAGVSSFGLGGSNAHVVLEEYIPGETTGAFYPPPYLLVLSARTEERLKAYASRLLRFLEAGAADRLSALDVTYTLQVGRDAMPFRLAFVINDLDAAVDRLRRYCQGLDPEKDIFMGQAQAASAASGPAVAERQDAAVVRGLMAEGRLVDLARLWVNGTSIDWRLFYKNGNPQHIALPTYPFEAKRHWVKPAAKQADGVATIQEPPLHPLLDRNTSTLSRQQYATRLRPEAYYLTDHVVSGRRIFPGAAMIEMARAAGELAANKRVAEIANIVWLLPLVGPPEGAQDNGTPQVQIRLLPQPSGVTFEIYSPAGDNKDPVHCQGKLIYEAGPRPQDALEAPADIAAIGRRCTRRQDGDAIYQQLLEGGIAYGPAFRTIRELYGSDREALARIELPEHLLQEAPHFGLHPSLIDGAMQAVIGLVEGRMPSSGATYLPFSLGRVVIRGPLPQSGYAHVTPAEGSDGAGEEPAVKRFDIRLLDDDGKVAVVLAQLSLRPMAADIGARSRGRTVQTLYCRPVWSPARPLPESTALALNSDLLLLDNDQTLWSTLKDHQRVSTAARVLLACPGEQFERIAEHHYTLNPAAEADYHKLVEALQADGIDVGTVIWRWGGPCEIEIANLKQRLERGLYGCFYLTQAFVRHRRDQALRMLYVYEAQAEGHNPLEAAVSGLMRTLRLEHPRLSGQTLALEGADRLAIDSLADLLLAVCLESDPADIEIRQGRQRYVKRLEPIEPPPLPEAGISLKAGGVYLITGGLGGLGRIMAEYITGQVQAQVVLIGRSELGEDQRELLAGLPAGSAGQVHYLKGDVTEPQTVRKLIAEVKARFGRIDGIVHSAGLVRDAYLVDKQQEDLAAVLAPKVHGSLNLDEASAAEPLDWFVMFSSMSAVTGNLGQCDYAYANSFMDHFAALREVLRQTGQRRGKTVSINWPLWEAGGMQIDDQTRTLAERTLGIMPLPTEDGLDAFVRSLGFQGPQLAVVAGRAERIRAKLLDQHGPQPGGVSTAQQEGPRSGESAMVQRLQQELAAMVCELLKIEADDIDASEDLSEYGFDSISVTALINEINGKFDLELTPPIFYEHPTLDSLAAYLWQAHPAAFQNRYSRQGATSIAPAVAARIEAPRFLEVPQPGPGPAAARDPAAEPIAIIGMSGVLPVSANPEALWQHMMQGTDLVTEIPPQRWDWRAFYGNPAREANKTDAKWGGFIADVDQFDAPFFKISPREAELMDPQQRIFLQTVWHTLEDAGYRPSELAGAKVGLFVGAAAMDYSQLLQEAGVSMEGFGLTGLTLSILANRISYVMNWHGPSEPVSTACSSSLVALHRAVEAIRNGGCDLAVAGGVNLILSPALHISLSKAGMLSPNGRCKTFDKDADGYVRGEGSGAVLLKPLSSAQAHGDHIYALIRDTAVNHSGHSNSLTAPNPNAQAALLEQVYGASGIDPTTVTYIETQGTGTNLGDPAEFNGMKMAFQKLYQRRGQALPTEACTFLGSVKTHIGHLETAAGIAGLLKVLLMFKYRTIPGNLHFRELNPFIDLKGSPFRIADRTRPWPSPQDSAGRPVSRRAGISAFGFGGVNAHAILEEYSTPADAETAADAQPLIFVLSARNPGRLKVYARQLAEFVSARYTSDAPGSHHDLRALAYTLQVGREPMEARLAVLAESAQALHEKLAHFAADQADVQGLFSATLSKREKRCTALMIHGEAGQAYIDQLMAKGQTETLARLWMSGVEIAWRKLYGTRPPRRLALPGYPFEPHRYWIPATESVPALADGEHRVTRLHPMIACNISTLKNQQYTQQLNGREFYLRDHVVDGRKVLPAVAYLEMARAAGELAGEGRVGRISHVVWAEPVVQQDDPQQVWIRLQPVHDRLDYAIGTWSPHDDEHIHGQGKLFFGDPPVDEAHQTPFDLEAARARCTNRYSGADCYRRFEQLGLRYGPSFQPICSLRTNGREALARLVLPPELENEFPCFGLHPTLMDGALQAIMGAMAGTAAHGQNLLLPFALKALEIHRPLTAECYAHVAINGQASPQEAPLNTFTIHLIDPDGRLLVHLQDLALRAVPTALKAGQAPSKEQVRTHKAEPPQPEALADTRDRQAAVEQQLKQLCAAVLKVDPDVLDKDEELSEYGMDSIMMMKLLNGLEDHFSMVVDPNAIAAHPTIEALAAHLLDQGLVKDEPAKALSSAAGGAMEPATAAVVESDAGAHTQKEGHARHGVASQKAEITPAQDHKIAVIGMACRFPGANTPQAFWHNLQNATSCIVEIPPNRWSIADHYSSDKNAPGKTYSKWGGYLEAIDCFDAAYFGISDQSALVMDPQHRLVLELSQELLDRAGYTRSQMADTQTGVFLGATAGPYIQQHLAQIPADHMKYVMANNIQNMMAARISDFFNLKGRSLTVDTACSSSLVAVDQACQEIQIGTCEMAIAGGIVLLLDPFTHIGFCKSEALSDADRSYVFDRRAAGFVLGEGVGMVLLKSLDRAVQDGDQILGVIAGSAVNNDGRTMGVTVPSLEGQKEVIQAALAKSGVNPETITCLEAHGTGTLLGDPIEIKAITQVYRQYTQAVQYCAVGSVKSNIGHLLHAAGVASLIKVLLAFQNAKIPATLHCENPHPRFKFETSPFYPNTKTADWVCKEGVRRAAISSFGFGGTNCHMILEAFVDAQHAAYKRKRDPLPPTRFQRKRYWLGKAITEQSEEEDLLFDFSLHEAVLMKVKGGEISPEQAMQLTGANA